MKRCAVTTRLILAIVSAAFRLCSPAREIQHRGRAAIGRQRVEREHEPMPVGKSTPTASPRAVPAFSAWPRASAAPHDLLIGQRALVAVDQNGALLPDSARASASA